MEQQNKPKPEENQQAELSDKDLEQVAGGIIIINSTVQKPALNTAEESLLPNTSIKTSGFNHNETMVRDRG
jgi:hypothetical protein